MQLYSFINQGFQTIPILIETDIRPGFPGFDIIGLADSAIKESRERIRCAIRNNGFKFPSQRILINLIPTTLKKAGSNLDLAISIGILLANEELKNSPARILLCGELSLSGRLISSNNNIAAIMAAKQTNSSLCIIASDYNKSEVIDGVSVIFCKSLTEALSQVKIHLHESLTIQKVIKENKTPQITQTQEVFEHVIGMKTIKESLLIAASGRLNLFLFGPPGVGKTMMANLYSKLLNPLDNEQAFLNKRIYECAQIPMPDNNSPVKVLRHDCSISDLIGKNNQPGLVSLANNGVLILDEINSFSRKFLDTVKEITDAKTCNNFPSNFSLIATMNPCSCGNLGKEDARCTCPPSKITSHWAKVGSPLLDRFDIRVPIEISSIKDIDTKPSSYYIEKATEAQNRKKHRNNKPLININELSVKVQNSNARALVSLSQIASTLADLDNTTKVTDEHIQKALQLRHYGIEDHYFDT